MSPLQKAAVVKHLKKVRKSAPNGPNGLPRRADNSDEATDGIYRDDGLVDPGIQHGVTGTGNGPIIGIG